MRVRVLQAGDGALEAIVRGLQAGVVAAQGLVLRQALGGGVGAEKIGLGTEGTGRAVAVALLCRNGELVGGGLEGGGEPVNDLQGEEERKIALPRDGTDDGQSVISTI